MKEHHRKVKMPKARKPSHPTAPALEWLSDISGRTVRVTAIGNQRILIENHTGIQDYTDECVCLRTATGLLHVHGYSLTLCEVRENALIIHGFIRQVDLPPEGGRR